jgi:hypothetical protein
MNTSGNDSGKQLKAAPFAFTPSQVIRLGKWQQRHRKQLKRSWEGVCSPRQAIKLQCLDCCGEDTVAIKECGDRCCPLWKFRPFQPKERQDSHE